MKNKRLLLPLIALPICLLSAYLCAAVYVVALALSLPPTDLAHGQQLATVLSDPFVRVIAAFFATVAGLVAFPIALFCLWHRHLLRCSLFVVGLTVLYIAFATPVAAPLGLIGSPLVALASLLFCRATDAAYFQNRASSATVA